MDKQLKLEIATFLAAVAFAGFAFAQTWTSPGDRNGPHDEALVASSAGAGQAAWAQAASGAGTGGRELATRVKLPDNWACRKCRVPDDNSLPLQQPQEPRPAPSDK